jgi:nucleoside-diphosphate-sugar epimerase
MAGIKRCESHNRQHGRDYRSVMPTNLYGPGDSFHPEDSRVLPALMRRFHQAAQRGDAEVVVVGGSGTPMGEVLHVDDMAAASVTGFGGRLVWDARKPDGPPRKLLDVSRLPALDWRVGISLEQGLRDTSAWFRNHAAHVRGPKGLASFDWVAP